MEKKSGQKPRAGIKNATKAFFFFHFTISGLHNKEEEVTFFLKFGSFVRQRLRSVNKKVFSPARILEHICLYFHSFWFGFMAARREESTLMQKTLSVPRRVFFLLKL